MTVALPAIFSIAAGGAVGSLLRYGTNTFVCKYFDLHCTWGTLAANIAGCFLIGVVWVFLDAYDEPLHLKLFLVTGLLGGYTTFSSFALESFHLFREGEFIHFATNILISNIIGIIAVFAGYFLARFLLRFFIAL